MAASAVASGLVVVDKPAGMTSHDVVARLRRLLRTRRIGHAGTLDPMATGVLVCGVGRATKLLGHLALDTKAYLATVRLGAATSTDDAEGEPVRSADASEIGQAVVRARLAALSGDIEQVPSAVSAVKVGGRRAYELARAGEQVTLPARAVTVSRLDLLELRRGERVTDLDVAVECSSGTYVRALARDLGEALGVGGHLVALRRTRVGQFDLTTARSLDELAADPALSLDLDAAVFAAFGARSIGAEEAVRLSHGGRVPAVGMAGTHAAIDPDGHAVALLSEQGGVARPVLVLRPAGGS
ncbi:MAG: tRNA pseudouridine(55) synthase TruB [Pseudonocardiaceae bacterium]|nr:tRNA pseudouridine(55) synthase TruB [Pseudonocardiaceae bacterium]